MVSMRSLGVLPGGGTRSGKRGAGRLETGAENSGNQEHEEGDGRSPKAEWEAIGLRKGQIQDGARKSNPWCLASLLFSELIR